MSLADWIDDEKGLYDGAIRWYKEASWYAERHKYHNKLRREKKRQQLKDQQK